MMYKVQTSIPIVFEDGKAVISLQGKMIDLFKLDSVSEFRTVLRVLAQQAVDAEILAAPQEQQPVTVQGADFSANAEKIREEFHKQAQESAARLTELANTYESSLSKIDEATRQSQGTGGTGGAGSPLNP